MMGGPDVSNLRHPAPANGFAHRLDHSDTLCRQLALAVSAMATQP